MGLCADRSPQALAGLLGILKAGGAYVPLDPSYPPERLAFMQEDAALRVVLAQNQHAAKLPKTSAEIVFLERAADAAAQNTGENIPSEAKPDHLAYVLYTSGSTGKPKGVAMSHLAFANLIGWQTQRVGFAPGARTSQFVSWSFDVSLQEIFSTLCSGGSLVIVEEAMRRDPAALLRLIDEQSIERLFVPSAFLQSLAEYIQVGGAAPGSLKEVITAGEQLQVTRSLMQAFAAMPAVGSRINMVRRKRTSSPRSGSRPLRPIGARFHLSAGPSPTRKSTFLTTNCSPHLSAWRANCAWAA